MERTARIERLRENSVRVSTCYEEFAGYFFEYIADGGLEYGYESYGDAYIYACSKVSVNISEDELIVGKPLAGFTEEAAKVWSEKGDPAPGRRKANEMGGQDSHMAIDYDTLLECGVKGIIARIEGYEMDCDDAEKLAFYACAKKCLQGVMLLADRYSERAKELADECTDSQRKSELIKLSEICKKVPANPADSFYEAIQSAHFVTYCISNDPQRQYLQYQLGHPDRYLYRFYENDINNGTLTKSEAQELFDCLGIQINNRVVAGLSSGYMVGGRYEDGSPVANDLTYMGMDVVENIRLVYPSVGLCYNKDMPEDILKRACEILSKGCSHPAIFNDDLIAQGLIHYGVPEKDSHNYIHSTCVEITPVGASNVWVADPYTNSLQLLLDILDREYESYDELKKTLFERLAKRIENNFYDRNNVRKFRSEHSCFPLVSCFVKDCLARGKDIDHGGAIYNWITPSFVGVANLVDSLYAVKIIVFDNKEMTLSELKAVLDSNFEGNEALRLRLLNKLPKYGNDIEEPDALFSEIVAFIVKEFEKYTPVFDGRYIPSVFCWEMHERFGRDTGASPDGRKAGFPLGDGSGPCQGREKCGPTASVLSTTKWSHKELIGGVALNMKFSKKTMTAQSMDTMLSLIKTYLDRGGFEMQINVVDKETLIKAKENPESYKDLVVRIGGYSDYFTRISEKMQDEVILRTEHEI